MFSLHADECELVEHGGDLVRDADVEVVARGEFYGHRSGRRAHQSLSGRLQRKRPPFCLEEARDSGNTACPFYQELLQLDTRACLLKIFLYFSV